MKRSILLICISILVLGLFANPGTYSILSEVWFADNGHFYLELVSPAYITNFNQIQIRHGDDIRQFPLDIDASMMFTMTVFDVNAYFPDMVFNPVEDSVIIRYEVNPGYYYDYDKVKWGEDFSNDINAPLPGQSLVKIQNPFPVIYPFYWCKEQPPTPGDYMYNSIARDTLVILVTNQDGIPLPNIPLYNMYTSPFSPLGYTNSSGIFVDTLWAGKLPLKVVNPETNAIIYENTYWLEPNHTTFLPIEISYTQNNEQITPVVISIGLHAYPNPFNSTASGSVSFTYDGETKLSRDSYLRIYNTKGRFITKIDMNSKGMTSWTPASETASGLYLARLISGNRIVDTTTFTILK
jgi:hypothetical protein